MRRLIAHIGLHKTGTTAFQQWVADNRSGFADVGIHVPAVGVMDAGNHRLLVEALYAGGRNGIVDEFHAAVPAAGDVMITSEWLTSPPGLAGLGRLAELADRYGMERHAILVVRDRRDLLVSWYVQLRKSLQLETPDYESFLELVRRQGRFDLPTILGSYAGAGFKIEQVPYEVARQEGIVATLARLPLFDGRLDSLIPTSSQTENTSVGALTLIASDILRRSALDRGVRLTPAVRRSLRSRIAEAATELPQDAFDPERSPIMVTELSSGDRALVERVVDTVARAAWSDGSSGVVP